MQASFALPGQASRVRHASVQGPLCRGIRIQLSQVCDIMVDQDDTIVTAVIRPTGDVPEASLCGLLK